MTDRMTPEQRHRCMSHIRSKATKPELTVRRWLWGHGYRYRLNVKSVPGKPDIVLRTYRTAIFVNGCFWHGHGVQIESAQVENSKLKVENHPSAATESQKSVFNPQFQNSACCKIPQTNRAFWVEKIRRNQQRDQRNYRLLQENGWQVVVVWECQLKPDKIERTMREVELLLNDNLLRLYKKHAPAPYSTEEEMPLPTAAEEGGEHLKK
ncbi:MAG: DNA mismatch endonuclease Vsr [Bacteroidales bacterium]|nr:DNA mismatch endonuclease Vsr [Bacteroidales bacterium]